MTDLNVKVKSTKLLVENTRAYLLELELQRFIIQSTESISNKIKKNFKKQISWISLK